MKQKYAVLFGEKSNVSKVDPCGVCGEGVDCNSVQCTKCQRLVHRRSNVPRQVSSTIMWGYLFL